MTATASESLNFYWHCQTAELLIRHFLPHSSAAISSNIHHALRMATLCAAGKNGVHHATEKALALKISSGRDWHQLGLIREHAVPVSLIQDEVLRVAKQYLLCEKSRKSWAGSEVAPRLHQHDHENWGLPANLSRIAPLSAAVAAVIRTRTVLVWTTKEEDSLLNDSGVKKMMPAGKKMEDSLARYEHCKIKTVDLRQKPPVQLPPTTPPDPFRPSNH